MRPSPDRERVARAVGRTALRRPAALPERAALHECAALDERAALPGHAALPGRAALGGLVAPPARAPLIVIALVLAAVLAGVVHAQERPRLTFAQLSDSLRANFDITREMKSYGGREVEIQGFIVPAGPPDLSFFLLSRVSALGNYCCEAPVGQDETVYVFAPRGARIAYDPLRVYRVRGTFEAGKHVDAAYGVSMFRIRDAKVEEAVGARIFKVGESPKP